MRKICEIDAAEVYHRSGEMPWDNSLRKSRLNTAWIQQAFTTPQRQFLEKHRYTLRPHPKHNPTVELFIDEQDLRETDWTVIRLLF